jgi:hypothetical protein
MEIVYLTNTDNVKRVGYIFVPVDMGLKDTIVNAKVKTVQEIKLQKKTLILKKLNYGIKCNKILYFF